MKKRWNVLLVAAVLATLMQPLGALACAVCYGEPDSPASKGLTWAILALGAIVLAVLAGIVGFFVYNSRRAAAAGMGGAQPALKGGV